MNKKILTLAILGSLSTGSFAQDPRNSDIKVTAKIDPGCFIEAENINFGVLMMPLTDNRAQSNITVKCSKDTQMSLSILYGNVSNSSGTNSRYTINQVSSVLSKIYLDGQPISKSNDDIYCASWMGSGSSVGHGGVAFSNEALPLFENAKSGWQNDLWGICSPNGVNNSYVIKSQIEIGALKGLVNNEVIKYSLELPNQSSTIWDSNNKYYVKASGEQQTIPMKANIKKTENPTHRLSPDNYQDTLTVVLNY